MIRLQAEILATRYEHIIGWIVARCPAPDKFAHTYAGLAIWLIATIILRSRRGSVLPLIVVIAAEIGNECIDRIAHGSWLWRDTLGDMAATWFWPTIFTVVARWVPRQGRRSVQ